MATPPFLIYESWSTLITNLPTEQAGELIQAMCAKQLGQDYEITDPSVKAIFMMISQTMDENRTVYSQKAERNQKAAQKRWHKADKHSNDKHSEDERSDESAVQTDADAMQTDANAMQTDANACERMQTDANACEYRYKYKYKYKKETHSRECVKKAASQQPPSIDDVRAFARDAGMAGFNADAFWNFYESKGWKIGGDDMADWRSAARCWHARDRNKLTRAPDNKFLDIPKQDIDYDAIAAARRKA